jgi:hypothetical protein
MGVSIGDEGDVRVCSIQSKLVITNLFIANTGYNELKNFKF